MESHTVKTIMIEEERLFNMFLSHELRLEVTTRTDGENVVAELPELGLAARGVTVQGVKQYVVNDAIAEFERMNKAILKKQYAERDREDGLYVWQEGLLRMHIIRGLLAHNLEPIRKTLIRKRHRKPTRSRVMKKGLRSVSASFEVLCMGRSCIPF